MLHFLICLDEFPILNDGGGQGGTSNCFIGKIFIFEDFLLKLVIVFTLYRYWYQQISVTERKMRNYSVFLPTCWIWKPQWGQLCFCWRQQSDCTELNYLHRQKKTTKKQGQNLCKMQRDGGCNIVEFEWQTSLSLEREQHPIIAPMFTFYPASQSW